MHGVPDADNNAEQALNRHIIKGVIVSFGAQGVRVPLQFASQILLARLLAPAEFGLVAMAIPVLMLAQTIGELGLAQAIIQRPVLPQADISGLYWVSLLFNAGLAAAMIASAPLVASFYGEPRLTLMLMVLSGLLLSNAVAAQHMALMARQLKFGRMAIIDIACLAVATAVGVGCALAGAGYWSLVAMQGTNVLVIAVLSSMLSGWRPSRPGRGSGVRSLLGFGAHLTGYNLVNYAGSNLDIVLVGYGAGSTSLGLYDRSMKLVVSPLWQVSMPLTRVATGLLARYQAQPAEYRRVFLTMLQGLLLVLANAFAFGAMRATTLVPALLGRQWTGAAPVVAWLCVSAIFVPFAIAASWLFVSQAKVAAQLRWSFLRAGLSLATLVACIRWGVEGVAIGYALMAPLIQGSALWGATRQGPVRLRDVAGATLPILASTAVAMAVLYATPPLIGAQFPVAELAASLLILLVVSTATLMCFPTGLAFLRRIVRAAGQYRRAET